MGTGDNAKAGAGAAGDGMGGGAVSSRGGGRGGRGGGDEGLRGVEEVVEARILKSSRRSDLIARWPDS